LQHTVVSIVRPGARQQPNKIHGVIVVA
jgi:hypothetical protein